MAKLKFMWSSTNGTEYELADNSTRLVTANITVATWHVGNESCGATGNISGYDLAFWARNGVLNVGWLLDEYGVVEVYATDASGNRATSYTINGETITPGSGGGGSTSPTEYTVSYNANGGSGAPSSQTTSGGVVTLSTRIPTRSGYTFLGWHTQSWATTARYNAGGTYNFDSDVVLYAVWKSNSGGSTGGGTSGTISNTFPTASGKYYLCRNGKRITAIKNGVTYYLYIKI